MVDPIGNSNLMSSSLLSRTSGAESAGEVENDGDSDDAAQASGVSNQAAARGLLSNYMGTQIDTSA